MRVTRVCSNARCVELRTLLNVQWRLRIFTWQKQLEARENSAETRGQTALAGCFNCAGMLYLVCMMSCVGLGLLLLLLYGDPARARDGRHPFSFENAPSMVWLLPPLVGGMAGCALGKCFKFSSDCCTHPHGVHYQLEQG